MEIVFPLAAFLATLLGTLRSLGLGLAAAAGVGYFNGIVRANFLGVYTTFMFDAGLAGLYLGFFAGRPRDAAGVWGTTAGRWVAALVAWPALLSLVPVNDPLVQVVALRATVWFLPVFLIATRLTAGDLAVLARGLSALNLAALAGGVYVYVYGVEAVYPQNAVTDIIYRSKDVGEYHRVPSTFLSAHAYGGAMLFTLPLLLDRVFGRGSGPLDRGLAAAGAVAAVGGILLCAARQPVATLAAAAVAAWAVSRFNPVFGFVTAGLLAGGALFASTDARLQRAATLDDAGTVTGRIQGSANEQFLEILVRYPVGAGMGSAAGTSIPFFLAGRAPEQIGLENEFCRILVDQGWVGLGLWVGFLGWLFARPPTYRPVPWGLGVVLMYSLCATLWATAFIGTGTLSAIPGACLLLTQMGVLARLRESWNRGAGGRA